jgi:hypothetical protein
MVALRVVGFSGVVPRRGARLLSDNQAQVSVNCRLTSGYFGPLKQPARVVSPGVAGIKSIFRMTDGVNDFWLSWNVDVDAAKGPIAGDTTFRTYYSGDGEPRVTNLSLATSAGPFPGAFFVLGVYPPADAPSVSSSGGVSSTTVSRAFAYTFVTPFGEESQPSPASAVVTAKIDDTWTVGSMDVAPLNSMAVTNASWSTGVATLTVASTFGLRVGEQINVTAMNPSGFNVSKAALTAVTATQVSYALASNPGAFVAGGTLARVAPHNTSGMTKNIYWTETLASGTVFRLVKNVTVATVSTTVPNGSTISTADMVSQAWVMPPTDMKGMILMPNGIMCGFHQNELLFSPNFIPYAFPLTFRLTTDYDIVGLGVSGSTLVVGTKGKPYVVTGIDPSSMTMETVEKPWPCQAKHSFISSEEGVAFATPMGLAVIGSGGRDIVTRDLYTLEEWQQLNLSTINAAQYAGRYVFAHDIVLGQQREVISIDKGEFAAEITANSNAQIMYSDPSTGFLYVVLNDTIYQWDADPGNVMTADWMSKEFVFPKPINLGAAKVDSVFTMSQAQIAAAQAAAAAAAAAAQALITALKTKGSSNGTSLNGLAVNGSSLSLPPPLTWNSLTFQLYADGVQVFSKTLTDNKAFHLPAGYKKDNVAFRLNGNITVKAIVAAESMKELEKA